MDVVILLVFISLVLVGGAILLLVSRVHGGDVDHGDQLSLLPLEQDLLPEAQSSPSPSPKEPGV